MFRLFKRAPDNDNPQPERGDAALDYRASCRAIHDAFLEAEEGTLARDEFLDLKVGLLRAAVRDADASEEGHVLVRILETLRLTRAVNDVELDSVQRHFRS